MQNDFLTGPLGNDHCRAAIPEVVDLIKNQYWDAVYLTQDTHFPNYSKTLEGEKLPVQHCQYGTDGWKIEPSILKALVTTEDLAYELINKPTFGSVDLHKAINDELRCQYGEQCFEALGNGGGLEFHVCGVCTSICVLANVVLLRACWPDAKIVVHANACGDVTKEMHEAAKICFAAQQCEVVGEP